MNRITFRIQNLEEAVGDGVGHDDDHDEMIWQTI